MSTAGHDRILVGVDGSPHSNAAVRWALGEAAAVGARVEAVFAWQVPFMGMPGAFDRSELEVTAKTFLNETVSALAPHPPVPLELTVAEGDPAASLITAASRADLLVLGTRGRSPIRGLLLGSVSQACAAGAPCPVVIVKAATTA